MLEKNIGPPTEAMHTNVTRGERFSLDKKILKSLMRNIVVELLKALKRSPFICCPCLPGMDV